MRAQQQPLALRLRLLPRDEQRVLRIPRRMVRRKIQRLEVVVIRLDDRPFGDGIAEFLEDANNLAPRLASPDARRRSDAARREGKCPRWTFSSAQAESAAGTVSPDDFDVRPRSDQFRNPRLQSR